MCRTALDPIPISVLDRKTSAEYVERWFQGHELELDIQDLSRLVSGNMNVLVVA